MPELTLEELEKKVEDLKAELEEVKNRLERLEQIEKPKPATAIKEPPKPEHKRRIFPRDS